MTEININDKAQTFRASLIKNQKSKRLLLCYQCGSCTNDCPVAKRVKEFRPRNIARLAIYGQKDRLFSSDLLWLCAGCYTCYERCPQQVHVSEIVATLRQIAFSEGKIHNTIKNIIVSLPRYGYITEVGEFENELRQEEGLPPAPQPPLSEISTIMKMTGISKKLMEIKQ